MDTMHTNEITLPMLINWQSKVRQVTEAVRSNLVVRAFELSTALHGELEREIKAKEDEADAKRRGSQAGAYKPPSYGARGYSSGYGD